MGLWANRVMRGEEQQKLLLCTEEEEKGREIGFGLGFKKTRPVMNLIRPVKI